jgi:hypothetical protein
MKRQKNRAEAGSESVVSSVGVLEGFYRLPILQWACTPPLRLTPVPLNVPLTEASAHLKDNRPCARSIVGDVPLGQVTESLWRKRAGAGHVRSRQGPHVVDQIVTES